MIVYHSSYMIIDKPDVLHSREALDFGKGFYVTVLHEQAVRYAERFKLRGRKAYLNIYELNDEWRKENIKVFSSYDEEWLDFIAANRKLLPVEHFDAVEGGVANDKIFRTVELYFAEEISKEDALKRLKFEKTSRKDFIGHWIQTSQSSLFYMAVAD
ncbi:MAG: DUF3990 domain-containing protein [Prevotellaceae bacterium]|nr:DUF3990 domain-containing protein [Prevotellaceae bacterium]